MTGAGRKCVSVLTPPYPLPEAAGAPRATRSGCRAPRVAAALLGLLGRAVAGRAQRLNLAMPEQIRITTMRDDVIADRGDGHHSPLRALRAARLCPQLRPRLGSPALRPVPAAPWLLACTQGVITLPTLPLVRPTETGAADQLRAPHFSAGLERCAAQIRRPSWSAPRLRPRRPRHHGPPLSGHHRAC